MAAATRSGPTTVDRRSAIADAALKALEAGGSRGLTHREVDRRAALPLGSTSNYFPTREALLTAALRRLVELERPSVEALEALVPHGPYEPREAAEVVAGVVRSWITPEHAGLEMARYELFLESRRRPEFQAALDQVRREYLELTEQLLPAAGCTDPRSHAPQLLALLDGLVLNQLLQPATALGDAELVGALERFFETC